MIKEEWRDIKGHESRYQISNWGRVRSFANHHKGRSMDFKLLKSYSTGNYLKVNIDRKNMAIHREVAKAFIPNHCKKLTVNHKDGNKLNNNISNLEWLTYSENMKHAYRIGLQTSRAGENNGFPSKLNKFQVQKIKLMNEMDNLGCVKISKIFNVSKSLISRIIKGKAWKHVTI